MRIFVKAKTNAKREEVKDLGDNHFLVAVKEPPREGRANDEIIRLLAEHFGISKSRIVIISGETSKEKVIDIEK